MVLSIALTVFVLSTCAYAQGGLQAMMEPVVPPVAVEAFDTPDDDGGSITLTWPKDA
ncbi:MAG: hypothetical protein HOM86_09490, partial [Gemmatimonadetes bacterium]|nr:hypothetical protein [Gemmatimonadota bacterium]